MPYKLRPAVVKIASFAGRFLRASMHGKRRAKPEFEFYELLEHDSYTANLAASANQAGRNEAQNPRTTSL